MKKILRIIGAFVIVCCGVLGLSACGESKVADNTEYYDAVTKTLKLQKSYTDRKSVV